MGEPSLEQVVEQAVAAEAGEVTAAVLDFVRRVAEGADPVATEEAFRGRILTFGARLTERALTHAETDLRAAVRRRGHRAPDGTACDGTLKSKGVKRAPLLTLLGEVRVARWTAQCRACGAWLGAVDELLGVDNGMTGAAASAVAATGVTIPFEQAETQLRRMTGLAVDDNRIQRTVAAAAPRAVRWATQDPAAVMRTVGFPPPGTWITVLIDGGRIRFRDGAVWREPCTALILWERPDGPWEKIGVSHPTDKAHVTGVLDVWLEAFRKRGRRKVAIIADGAEWIWRWAARHAWTAQVLDYYHVKEHVWEAARGLHGDGTPAAARWVDDIMARLWRGWIPSTIALLDRKRPRGWDGRRQREALHTLATYLENHAGLIDYARRRAEGCRIGSGAIESFCKQLFSMRMKGAGMFWSEEGARHVMDLRTVYLTGKWDQLWRSPIGNSSEKAA